MYLHDWPSYKYYFPNATIFFANARKRAAAGSSAAGDTAQKSRPGRAA